MAAFSATEAAFAGFSLIGKRPLTVIGWAALYLVIGVIAAALIIQFAGPQFAAMQEMSARQAEGEQPDPAAALAMVQQMGAVFLVAIPFALLFYALIYASAYRAILRPENGAPFHLSFGGDELRQALLMVVMFLIFIGVYLLTVVGGAILIGIAMAAAPEVARVPIAIVLGLVCFGAFAFVMIRLSLAGPATFAEGKLIVFKSWGLTRGAFWSLFGAYALAFAVMVVVLVVVYGALLVGVLGANGFSFEAAVKFLEADVSSFGAYFTPARIAYLTVSALLSAFIFAMMLSPAAYAYRELTGGEAVKQF